MLLKDIIKQPFKKAELQNIDIVGVSRDSRQVKANELFYCFSLDQEEALKQCQQALQAKAAAVVCQLPLNLPNCIAAKDVRSEFANACANFYHRACDKLKIIGVTGTNGKTTTTYIIAQILQRNGFKSAVIGTNGVFYNGKVLPCPLTTPDADFLHKTFDVFVKEGVEYVIMEVSAHAIAQKRIDGIKFEIGVLTNITQDHLDYFKTFAAYQKTKLEFLNSIYIKTAVVCADDKSCKSVLNFVNIPMITYGLANPCDAFAMDMCFSIEGTHFLANVNDHVFKVKTNLVGKYNVQNCLAALCVCQKLGLNEKQMQNGLAYMYPVEGRFNVINFTGKFVVIDFAHTPDGLKNVLTTAKSLTNKKVHVVFGCGGNRDKDKRHKMGAIAEKYADSVCLTNDNPRFENPLDIFADIQSGMKKQHFLQPDRMLAIKETLSRAEAGDIIVVAGKGAEKYQEIDGIKTPYNDFDAVYNIFKDNDPILNRGKGL